jgi:hypothetical protein
VEKVVEKIIENMDAVMYVDVVDHADLDGEYLGDVAVAHGRINTELELWVQGNWFVAIGNPVVEPDDVVKALGLNVVDAETGYLVLPRGWALGENERILVDLLFAELNEDDAQRIAIEYLYYTRTDAEHRRACYNEDILAWYMFQLATSYQLPADERGRYRVGSAYIAVKDGCYKFVGAK